MDNYNYFCNSFIAFSIDTAQNKEYYLYSIGRAREFLNDIANKKPTPEYRELGEFVLDFTTTSEEYLTKERDNILFDYILELTNFIKKNKESLQSSDYFKDEYNQFQKIITILDRPLLSDNFLKKQKEMKRDNLNQYSLYEIFKNDQDITETNTSLRVFYLNNRLYIATDFDFIGLMRFYLEKLYEIKIFPRKCMVCGEYFFCNKKHGEVICSNNCRKTTKSRNSINYYNNLSETELIYTKLYRKWKKKIDRAENKFTINKAGIKKLEEELKELMNANRTLVSERKKGNVPEKDGIPDYDSFDNMHKETLERYDSSLYQLFDSLKRNQ